MNRIVKSDNIKYLKKDKKSGVDILPLPFDLKQCKQSFVTRNIDLSDARTLITGNITPQPGDLVIAEVTRLRQHCRIEQPNGRRSRMFVKDKILVCYGNRYAPDQFEALVPDDLSACHLVAGGGIASKVINKSPAVKPATEIMPLGLIGDSQGEVLNVSSYSNMNGSIPVASINKLNIPVIVVAGSSMNSGKTTCVASLIKGLEGDGYMVAAAKVTGTGSGGDLWHFLDAGAETAIDFTDAGYASTYKLADAELESIFSESVSFLKSKTPDAIIIEIADGILQDETRNLLLSPIVQNMTTAMIFTAGDSCSALFGLKWLKDLEYNVIGISGVVSSNPLGTLEVQNSMDIPVISKKQMTSVGFGHGLYESVLSKDLVYSNAE